LDTRINFNSTSDVCSVVLSQFDVPFVYASLMDKEILHYFCESIIKVFILFIDVFWGLEDLDICVEFCLYLIMCLILQ
jgi:hypothetical protein